jgi:hypothetical protein
MNTLSLNCPISLAEHFDIPVDDSAWGGQYLVVPREGRTPQRERAQFRSISCALRPITTTGTSIDTHFGVYIFAMNWPTPALYVGLAANGGKSPEGIGKRLRKHRIKSSGSHVGSHLMSVGGVNHTQGWRNYAPARHQYFTTNAMPDDGLDIRIVIGEVLTEEGLKVQSKVHLERFEASIATNEVGILDRIKQLLWPDVDPRVVQLLTTRHGNLTLTAQDQIQLWQ